MNATGRMKGPMKGPMKKSTLWSQVWILGCFSLAARAAEPEEVWLTVTRGGLDSAGRSAFKKFELEPSGRVVWEAASLGRILPGGCSPGGGRLEGSLSPSAAERIGKLAIAAIDSQSKPASAGPPQFSPRTVRHSVQVTLGDVTRAGSITRVTPDSEKLEAALSGLYPDLKPVAAVALKVERAGPKQLHLRFVAPGPSEVKLLLPQRASEVFSASGFRVAYAHKGSPPEQVALGPNRRVLELDLALERTPGVPAGSVLRYSTALVKHHEEGKSVAVATPDLYLCGEIP